MQNTKKAWTPEDDDFLLESYGLTSMKYMMGRLKRTEEAIRQRYKELTGSKDVYMAGGMLSPRQVGPALGVDHRTVTDWIHHHGLKAKQLNKPIGEDKEKNYRYFLDPYEIWRWVGKNRERVNFARVIRGEILPEPSWLEDEIKKSQYVKPPKNWTDAEDEAAWFWWQSGVNYREIAKRLDRPEKGTQRRLTVIKKRKGVAHVKTN
jgi:hypothetical protein